MTDRVPWTVRTYRIDDEDFVAVREVTRTVCEIFVGTEATPTLDEAMRLGHQMSHIRELMDFAHHAIGILQSMTAFGKAAGLDTSRAEQALAVVALLLGMEDR